MPTYEYHCTKCSADFEFYQSMKDDALTICPKERCPRKAWGKGKIKRLLGTGAGLIFKGSGFYITDYRSEGYKTAARSDSASGGDAKKADAKPETKAEAKPEKKAPETPKTPPKKD